MPRSLPERTVDAWVAAAVCARFPNARVWGPTQADQANWDYGASLGDGKIFILEDKATDPVRRKSKKPLQTHRITVDRDQLDWYCDEVEPDTGVPAYYVLPAPPWDGPVTGSAIIPDQSEWRVAPGAKSFTAWAWVMRCEDLRKHLNGAGALLTHTLPIGDCNNLHDFLEAVQECTVGGRIGAGVAGDVAVQGDVEASARQPTIARQFAEDRARRSVGSALTFFVPFSDLTSGKADQT